MADNLYTVSELKSMPLVDEIQWERLKKELPVQELVVFVDEYLCELSQTWLMPESKPLQLEADDLRSLAHRFAGTAGTMGLKKIRYFFLCLEYAPTLQEAQQLHDQLDQIVQESKVWLQSIVSSSSLN